MCSNFDENSYNSYYNVDKEKDETLDLIKKNEELEQLLIDKININLELVSQINQNEDPTEKTYGLEIDLLREINKLLREKNDAMNDKTRTVQNEVKKKTFTQIHKQTINKKITKPPNLTIKSKKKPE